MLLHRKEGTTVKLLEISNLHVYYGGIHALKGISLDVENGEIVSLIGSNGAGKSTTLMAISGLVKAREGEIKLSGNTITHMAPHKIAGMGIAHVPEGRRIFPKLTIQENLEMGAFRLKDAKKIKENYEKVYTLFPRLRERINQISGTLSGGEQQMLAMGRALMMEPEILLLDEPSMGLSPVMVDTIFDTVVRLNKMGTTILLVEQNAQKALEVANRGYVIQTGTNLISDSAEALRSNDIVRKAYLGEE